MSVGQGLLEGEDVAELVSIAPDSIVYVDHTGATFVPQDDAGSGNVALYEINNTGDEIDFNLRRYVRDYNRPVVAFNTIFGPTEFDVYDRKQERTILSEDSGFHTDNWIVEIDDASPELRLTNFDDTQAAFYPYVTVYDKII